MGDVSFAPTSPPTTPPNKSLNKPAACYGEMLATSSKENPDLLILQNRAMTGTQASHQKISSNLHGDLSWRLYFKWVADVLADSNKLLKYGRAEDSPWSPSPIG